jgi:hypothetical protein
MLSVLQADLEACPELDAETTAAPELLNSACATIEAGRAQCSLLGSTMAQLCIDGIEASLAASNCNTDDDDDDDDDDIDLGDPLSLACATIEAGRAQCSLLGAMAQLCIDGIEASLAAANCNTDVLQLQDDDDKQVDDDRWRSPDAPKYVSM